MTSLRILIADDKPLGVDCEFSLNDTMAGLFVGKRLTVSKLWNRPRISNWT